MATAGLEMTSDELKELGASAWKDKNFSLAVQHYSKAIELEPESHVLFSNRSAAHASLQHWQEALGDADKCISLKPDWAKGYGRRAAAYEGLGERIKAKAAYQAGLDRDPGNVLFATAIRNLTVVAPAPHFVGARPVRPPAPEGAALWLNYAIVSTTILYIIPVLGAKGAFYAYRVCLLASLAKYALQLYHKFGLSRQMLSEWEAIKVNDNAHYFALCAMLLFWRPVPFVLMPVAATSIAAMVPALVKTVHALPLMLQKLLRERVDQLATDDGYMLVTAFAATVRATRATYPRRDLPARLPRPRLCTPLFLIARLSRVQRAVGGDGVRLVAARVHRVDPQRGRPPLLRPLPHLALRCERHDQASRLDPADQAPRVVPPQVGAKDPRHLLREVQDAHLDLPRAKGRGQQVKLRASTGSPDGFTA
jgi:tetratricopeptide (TPR) repeat protein